MPAGLSLGLRLHRRASGILETVSERWRKGEREIDSKTPSIGIPPLRKVQQRYLEVLLICFPQHSGRWGRLELFQPPPRAWTSSTASTMRRPRILTAVSSSVSAAL